LGLSTVYGIGIGQVITGLVLQGMSGWELPKRLAPVRSEMKVLWMLDSVGCRWLRILIFAAGCLAQ
jgi:hypothetical protein